MKRRVLILWLSTLLACICASQDRPTTTVKDCAPKYADSDFCEIVEPQYAEEAMKAKVKGKLVVAFTWSVDGCATDIRVVRPLGFGLDEAAIHAVKRFRLHRRPTPVPVTVEFNFDPKRPYPSTASTAPTCEETVERERTKK